MTDLYSKIVFNSFTRRFDNILIPYLDTGILDAGVCKIELNVTSSEAFGRCCDNHSEIKMVRHFGQEVRDNDVVWDIGANIGVSLLRRRLRILLSGSCGVKEDKGTAAAVPDTNDSTRCVRVGIGRSVSAVTGSLA